MVQKFCDSFQQCLSTYRQEIASNPFLLSLIGPFYGLTDYTVYENWKLTSDLRYFEASNLISALQNTPGLPEELNQLAADFIEGGYEAISSQDFPEETVREQLKFIYTILHDEAPFGTEGAASAASNVSETEAACEPLPQSLLA